MFRLVKCGAVLAGLFWSGLLIAGPLVPIPPERVAWEIDGILNGTFPLGNAPISANIGDPFTIGLMFELDTVWEQCSPCISVGDREWRGKITEFNLNIGGVDLVSDFDGIAQNFVIFRPGDDPSEADQLSLRLGSRASPVTPFKLYYGADVFDAAFSLYISDYTNGLFGEAPRPWLAPGLPGREIRNVYLSFAPIPSPFLWTDRPTLTDIRGIPEPSVPALMSLALLGLLLSRRVRYPIE